MKLLLLAGTGLVALSMPFFAGSAWADVFSADGSTVQTFSVPQSGTYDIVVDGAQGGGGSNLAYNSQGGFGARASGLFNLTAGEMLQIAIGIQGQSASEAGGGGGGGSFVIGPSDTPLAIAGGGGGGGGGTAPAVPGPSDIFNGGGGVASTGGAPSTDGNAGGSNGGGGFSEGTSSGGGGFSGNGSDGDTDGNGGQSFTTSATTPLAGGDGGMTGLSMGGNGGFGGGGGGFDGGGGGGGSFLGSSALDQILIAGINSGKGLVTITKQSTNVPEPASLLLLSVGLGGLVAVGRRRPR